MNPDRLRNIIAECVNDITFSYNRKQCGVSSEVQNYNPTFTMWCGNQIMDTASIDEVMSYPLFDGASLSEICKQVPINIA